MLSFAVLMMICPLFEPLDLGVFFYRLAPSVQHGIEVGSCDLKPIPKAHGLLAATGTWKPLLGMPTGPGKIELRGSASPTRIEFAEKYEFVICGSVDVARYRLFKLKANKKTRYVSGNINAQAASEIRTTIKKFGESCSVFTPMEALEKGEYALSPDGNNDIFDFGVGRITN